MRTTVTLDPDATALIERVMRERGISFKQAVNEAIRRGLADGEAAAPDRFRTPTESMGWRPDAGIDQALTLAGALEDEELARRLAARK